MTAEYLARSDGRPAWEGVLPGHPYPYFLRAGEGEHAKLFLDTFTVLLSGDETGGEFGVFTSSCPAGDIIPTHRHDGTHETFFVLDGAIRLFVQMPDGEQVVRALGQGDFAFVPAGAEHAYRIEKPTQLLGVASGGFERFFQHMGTPIDDASVPTPPFVPDGPRMGAAAQRHRMEFLPGFEWPEA